MIMKQFLLKPFLLLAAVAVLTTAITSCKGKMKDTDISAAIATKASSMDQMAGVQVAVKDGVVTMTGECKDDACKALCESTVKGIPGVKNVVNNCTVAPPPAPPTAAPVVTSADDALSTGLKDVLKDFPTVSSSVKEGVIALTGEIAKPKWMVLKQAIDKLTPKGYDLKGLKIK
jgi:hyperosmotically inducible periplasmic protein